MDIVALLLSYLLTCTSPAAVRAAALEYCVAIEILDPNETKYYFITRDHIGHDIAILADRYILLADAPLGTDAQLFPPRDAVNAALNFNRAYRQHLVLRQSVDLPRYWEIRAAIQETDALWTIWDKARDARSDCYYIGLRRQALEYLRRELGPEAYYRGRLPPVVPLWRFEEID